MDAQLAAIAYQDDHVSVLTRVADDQGVTALVRDAAYFDAPIFPATASVWRGTCATVTP